MANQPTTHNELRDDYIKQALRDAAVLDPNPDFETTKSYLPSDFDYLESEHIAFTVPPAVEAPDVMTVTAEPLAPLADRIAAAEDDVIRLNDELAQLRADVVVRQREEHAANAKLAAAIVQFQSGFVKRSALDIAREFQRSSQEQRRLAAEGKIPPPQHNVANSAIDRSRAWARGKDIDDPRGNPSRAVCEGKPVFPASRRGGYIKPPSVR